MSQRPVLLFQGFAASSTPRRSLSIARQLWAVPRRPSKPTSSNKIIDVDDMRVTSKMGGNISSRSGEYSNSGLNDNSGQDFDSECEAHDIQNSHEKKAGNKADLQMTDEQCEEIVRSEERGGNCHSTDVRETNNNGSVRPHGMHLQTHQDHPTVTLSPKQPIAPGTFTRVLRRAVPVSTSASAEGDLVESSLRSGGCKVRARSRTTVLTARYLGAMGKKPSRHGITAAASEVVVLPVETVSPAAVRAPRPGLHRVEAQKRLEAKQRHQSSS
jgi:hypothetical protein